MAAFPNLPRQLAGRINDLGNLSYLSHEGETFLRRDVIELFDRTVRELNRRITIQHRAVRQALEGDVGEPSEAVMEMCTAYAHLCGNARATRLAFNGILEAHEAFF